MEVLQILAWSNPSATGLIFGAGCLFLLLNIFSSFLSAIAYFNLGLVFAGLSTKIYVHFMGFLKKPCSDPLACFERLDVSISSDKIECVIRQAINSVNVISSFLKRIFLVYNFADSTKYAAVMYIITYIGAFCNTLTLITILWVLLFSLPGLYHNNRELFDQILERVKPTVQPVLDRLAHHSPQRKKENGADKDL